MPSSSKYRVLAVVPDFEITYQAIYRKVFQRLNTEGHQCGYKLEAQFQRTDLANLDVLIVYRGSLGNTLALIRLARKMQVKVLYEIDDDLLMPPVTDRWGQQYLKKQIPQLLSWFLAEADLIKAGSPELVARLRQRGYPNAFYLPYPAKLQRIDYLKLENSTVIGYFGTPHHQGDLEAIFPALLQFQQMYGAKVRFEFIGCAPRHWPLLGNVQVFAGIRDYDRFLRFLSERCWALGLAPMRPTYFNAAKSDSKFRDYTAAGVLGVYSDQKPYRLAVTQGVNGWVCDTTITEWTKVLQTAFTDPERHLKLRAARKRLLQVNRVSAVAQSWLEFFD